MPLVATVVEDMAMVIVPVMRLVMAIMIIPIGTATIATATITTATVTMATDVPSDITMVAGLVIVARMVIVDHGVDPGAGDDLKAS